jgi:hypothetical protein
VQADTPALTPLSTNATCQLEKTEKTGPLAWRAGRFRRAPAGKFTHEGEPWKRENKPNVGVSGALSDRLDAVNKESEKLETRGVAPQELVVANFSLKIS